MIIVTRDEKKASARETALAFALVLAVGLMNFHTEIFEEYRWNRDIESQWASVGWETLARRPAPTLVFPWTMIWKPAGTVTMAHPVLTKKVYNDGDSSRYLISAIVVQFSRDNRGRLESSQRAELINCRTETYATAGDLKEKKRFEVLNANGKPLPGRWQAAPPEVLAYFCKKQ
ncbi:MAG TPA: hypothetical protein VGH16_21125 [Candidatus Binatia bacterium]|jgi:hypothetical protein